MTEDELRELIGRHPVEGDPDEMREAFAELAAAGGGNDVPNGVSAAREKIGGTSCLILSPEQVSDACPIVHFHGGGYVFGSPGTHAACGGYLAKSSGRRVILPDYPLAPENVWPAPRAAMRDLLGALGQPCVLSGDSAGGHLALTLAREDATPEALLLFSPNTLRDYTLSATRREDRDAMNDHETDDRLAAMAFPGDTPDVPDRSPVKADLTSLPPTFIDVGTEEVLLDDSLLLARAAGLAGVRLTLRTRPGFHMAPLFAARYPTGQESLVAAADWLNALPHRLPVQDAPRAGTMR